MQRPTPDFPSDFLHFLQLNITDIIGRCSWWTLAPDGRGLLCPGSVNKSYVKLTMPSGWRFARSIVLRASESLLFPKESSIMNWKRWTVLSLTLCVAVVARTAQGGDDKERV